MSTLRLSPVTLWPTAFMLLAILFASCSARHSGASDFNIPLYIPKYASGFSIQGADGRESVMIITSNPWQGADSVSTSLLIVRDGEEIPDGYNGAVIIGNADRIIAMSSTHIALLEAVGRDSAVVGVSGIDYIMNPYVSTHRDSIADVGYEGNVNYELLLSMRPDIVLLYGVNGASPMEGKLKALGIPFMYVGDYLEESPLGKAEWMVALAEVTGRRYAAEQRFAGIPRRYDRLKSMVVAAAPHRPTVLLNAPYGDSWLLPPAESYITTLIRDAGAEPHGVTGQGNTSRPIGMEEAYKLASGADYWLNPGTATSIAEVIADCPKLEGTKPLATGNVYNNNRRTNAAGGNDYFESAVANPDLVLRDLIGIFHPQIVDAPPVYYRKLD